MRSGLGALVFGIATAIFVSSAGSQPDRGGAAHTKATNPCAVAPLPVIAALAGELHGSARLEDEAAFAPRRAVGGLDHGSVAKPLWKEVPRFREFRPVGVEVWHECGDLDLAVWIESQHRLGELRRAAVRALRRAYEAGAGMGVAGHELDVFLIEPASDRYLGRLCSFNQCPKGKRDCLVPGCGEIPFNKRIADFESRPDLLAPVAHAMLYRRDTGRLRSALDLSGIDEARRP